MKNEMAKLLEEAVSEGTTPGGVLSVWKDFAPLCEIPFGFLTSSKDSPVTLDTIYDVASLTKPVVTSTMTAILSEEGKLSISSPVKDFFPELKNPGILISHLLTHSSGLPAWLPFYEIYDVKDSMKFKKEVIGRILEEADNAIPSSEAVYSDLGFILIGKIVEKTTGVSLEESAKEKIFKPLKMEDSFFNPHKNRIEELKRIAPTEFLERRGGLILGEVHDDNCFYMGGVSGHAGLFSVAHDIQKFATELLKCYLGCGNLVSQETAMAFWGDANKRFSWRLGWDTPTKNSSAGEFISKNSIGHLGYTGTSIWIDLDRKASVVFLTNRVNPTSKNEGIKKLRPALHNTIFRNF